MTSLFKLWLLNASCFAWFLVLPVSGEIQGSKPNIIYILADDLGYGDVQTLNPKRGKIATPQMDKLAAEGMVFTDAHTGSSVCTPTRYGVLTGRYSWRTRLKSFVLWGFDQPLIAKDRLTVASLLKEQGYNTAIVGKWHLGLGLRTPDGKPTRGMKSPIDGVDWDARIVGGPVDLGFDSWQGIAASLDMPPYIYIEDDRFVGECTTIKNFYRNREGPAHADFEAIDVLPVIGNKSADYIQKQTADEPFFLYVPLTSPHTPILPTEEWKGRSGLSAYADFVMHTDAVVGQIVDAVDAAGLAENTIIIVTSDNGCSKVADIEDLQAQGHYPNGQFRGAKSDLWDGGHRVPFIVRWPAVVEPGSSSDEIICLKDLMATAADLAGATLPSDAGEDSVSFLPALKFERIVSSREGIVHHSVNGQFAIRRGDWKLIFSAGSGGWTDPTHGAALREGLPPIQLYNMAEDPSETENLQAEYPEVVSELAALLETYIDSGSSVDGKTGRNDPLGNQRWKQLEQIRPILRNR